MASSWIHQALREEGFLPKSETSEKTEEVLVEFLMSPRPELLSYLCTWYAKLPDGDIFEYSKLVEQAPSAPPAEVEFFVEDVKYCLMRDHPNINFVFSKQAETMQPF